MVRKVPKQGDIIRINLDPKRGHEQKGLRPYLCLSHELVSSTSNIAIFAPISNTLRDYPFYFPLAKLSNLQTTGKILLDQLIAIDYNARDFTYIETVDSENMKTLLHLTKLIFDLNKQ